MRGATLFNRGILALTVAALVPLAGASFAQPAAVAPNPPASPREMAPIDLTGTWVSIVNEDWRWRMMTAPKGDFPGVPLTQAGLAAANAWDPASDGSCKAYGVGGIMRMPTRVRINWVGNDVLKIETDAGQQTRELIFDRAPAANTSPTLQGFSKAQWQLPPVVRGQVAGGAQITNDSRARGGSLTVVTTNHTGGWVRKNGVPYSANAIVTEHYDRFKTPDGQEWFTVLTIVDDPANFREPFLTSSHFRRESDSANWHPKACNP